MVNRFLACALAFFSAVATADDSLGLSAEAIAHPERYVAPSDADPTSAMARLNEADRAAVREIASRTASLQAAALPEAPAASPFAGTLYRIFLSQSMTHGELEEAFAIARARADVVLVFRGPKPDQPMAAFMRWVRSLLATGPGELVPRVEIDPPAFRRAAVAVAPTIVRYDSDGRTAQVAGLLNLRWLDEHAPAGQARDLGIQGRVNDIVEADLEELLRARASQLDWGRMKRAALDRYVRRISNAPLPHVTTARSRRIDPSFVVTDEIVSADGVSIARPGARVNPLKLHAFLQLLVIIDAGSAEQVAMARELVAKERAKRRVTVLAAGLADADQLERVRAALNHPVYLLDATVRARFAIEAVPTTVEADGDVFVVRELVARGGS